MREHVKAVLKMLYLDNVARELLKSSQLISWLFKRKFGLIDHGIIQSYFGSHKIRKLHIGCDDHILDGWLNSDLFPRSSSVLHLDAREPFPFGDEVIDYIFSEHMIEHISYLQGSQMLSECFRILRKNGKIRISTPNLAFLIGLYKEDKSDLQKKYIKWSTDRSIKYAPYSDGAFVINNFVRDWGHQFIYDEQTLSASLKKAGFAKVKTYKLNESEDEALRNIEIEMRMPTGFYSLETFTLEGTK